MKKSITVITSYIIILLLSSCAGGAKYSFRNDTGEQLAYTSTNQNLPASANTPINASGETEVPFSPNFILVSPTEGRLAYSIDHTPQLGEAFSPNIDASDSLQVIISADYRVRIRQKDANSAQIPQPSDLGFPITPTKK